MSCLDLYTKIQLMLDSMQKTIDMLKDDSIRPSQRVKLEEYLKTLKEELKQLYLEYNRIISN